jgi:5-formyltetrahydrofolate cyclo-ligase
VSAAKAILRDQLRRERAALSSPYREEATARVNRRILDHPAVRTGRRIGAYAATAHELNIDLALEGIISLHTEVFLPRVEGDTLVFCAITQLSDLAAGFAGIREPAGPSIASDALDVLLVPGLGFDPTGRRIGYGGGYYDRTLAVLEPACVTIGIAFQPQILPVIPTEEHDLSVLCVLTDTTTYTC